MENAKSKERQSHETEEERRVASLDRLVHNGEWMMLRENKEYQSLSLEGKIAKATQAVNVRIKQMEAIFAHQLKHDREGAQVILDNTIKPMRNLKNALGERLVVNYQKRDGNDAAMRLLGLDRSHPASSAK